MIGLLQRLFRRRARCRFCRADAEYRVNGYLACVLHVDDAKYLALGETWRNFMARDPRGQA